MPINQVLYKKKNGLARYDPKRQAYVGYRIDVVVNKVRHRDGGFASRKDAERFIDRLKGDARDRRNGLATGRAPRVSELFKKRLEAYSTAITKRVLASFQELLESDLRVTEIRSSHFQIYANSRKVAPGTIRRELNELSAAFRVGPILFPETLGDYVPPKVNRPRRTKQPTKHVITREEKDSIVGNLQATEYQKSIGRLFSIAWYLGLRRGELFKLLKTDLKGRDLRVVRWKTNEITLFEDLPDEILDILKEAVEVSETEFIFSTKQLYPDSFYRELKKAVEGAGLLYGKGKLGAITLHSNRHSFVTRASEVADLATVGSMSAHSDDVMVAYYSHSTREKRKEMIRKMYGSDDLRAIYDKLVAGEMTFEAFKKVIR